MLNKLFVGYKTLGIMLLATAVFAGFGYLVVKKHSQPVTQPEVTQPQEEQNQNTQNPETPTEDQSLAGWKIYVNEKYGYELAYPPNLTAGSVSGNSVLGDAQNPVKGFHVGPLVFISLKGDLRKTAAEYFNESYNLALHPISAAPGEPTVSCTIDKIPNPKSNVKSVSCSGEGGAARYALIIGTDYDVFVDGYSRGFDSQDNGDLKDVTDYLKILASFKFGGSTSSQTQVQTQTTAQTQTQPNPPPPPAVQSFTIQADDSGATPSEITVVKGTKVVLTFNVSAQNVYYGGLDFRSSVANTGTIQAGGSKTIAFTANESFEFTPYWPASGVSKNYKIKVIVTAL